MKIAGLIAVVALMTSGGAFAQGQGPTSQDRAAAPAHDPNLGFQSIDRDRDGHISLAEWQAAGRQERGFRFMDANGDGRLTQDEFTAGLQRVQQRRANGTAQRN